MFHLMSLFTNVINLIDELRVPSLYNTPHTHSPPTLPVPWQPSAESCPGSLTLSNDSFDLTIMVKDGFDTTVTGPLLDEYGFRAYVSAEAAGGLVCTICHDMFAEILTVYRQPCSLNGSPASGLPISSTSGQVAFDGMWLSGTAIKSNVVTAGLIRCCRKEWSTVSTGVYCKLLCRRILQEK